MTRSRFIQVAFTCLVLLALVLVLAELLNLPWLRVAVLPLIFAIGISYEIWLWWGEGHIYFAILGGLLLTLVAAGFIAQQVS